MGAVASLQFIQNKDLALTILPPYILCLLVINLWFTINRLNSSSRIIAYIKVFLENRIKDKQIGWESFLRKHRILQNIINEIANDIKRKKKVKKIIKIIEKAVPDKNYFYRYVLLFHFFAALSLFVYSIYNYLKEINSKFYPYFFVPYIIFFLTILIAIFVFLAYCKYWPFYYKIVKRNDKKESSNKKRNLKVDKDKKDSSNEKRNPKDGSNEEQNHDEDNGSLFKRSKYYQRIYVTIFKAQYIIGFSILLFLFYLYWQYWFNSLELLKSYLFLAASNICMLLILCICCKDRPEEEYKRIEEEITKAKLIFEKVITDTTGLNWPEEFIIKNQIPRYFYIEIEKFIFTEPDS